MGSNLTLEYIQKNPRIVEIINNLKKCQTVRINNEVDEKSWIVELSECMDELYELHGLADMKGMIGSTILKLLDNNGLSLYTNMVYRYIDPKYTKLFKKPTAEIVKTLTKSVDELDLENITESDYREIAQKRTQVDIAVDTVARQKGFTLLDDGFSELNELEAQEKARFPEKVTMGESVAPKEGDDAEYDFLLTELQTIWKERLEIEEKIMVRYTTRGKINKDDEGYPPVSKETIKAFRDYLRMEVEFLRPYVDKKYRRDILQWMKMLYNYFEYSGTKAARDSGVEVAHLLDKKGNPIVRRVTKEQMDQKALPTLNLVIDHYEAERNLAELIADGKARKIHFLNQIYKENDLPNRDNRAVNLSGKLQHYS